MKFMKFITEEYLRDLYRKEIFSSYKVEKDQRLTPGAIQYLADKRIELIEVCESKENSEILEESIDYEKASNVNSSEKKLCIKLKAIEAKVLLLSSQIVGEDTILAQNISKLGRNIKELSEIVESDAKYLNVEAFDIAREELDAYDFEITDFHMQLKNSEAILKMNILYCSLMELKIDIIDSFNAECDGLERLVVSKLDHVIRSLSVLIKSAVGGKECQIRI